jgi:hypothetical protein
MRPTKSLLIALAVVAIGAGTLGTLWWERSNVDQKIQESVSTKKLLEMGKRLRFIWESGVISPARDLAVDCPEFFTEKSAKIVDYLRCNPDVIGCLSKTRALDASVALEKKGKGWRLSLQGTELEIELAPTCHEAFLPRRRYGLEREGQSTLPWDNFNRTIFVDRYLVTERDIRIWAHEKKVEGVKVAESPEDFPKPATHLTLAQMKNYCFDQHKHLMNAFIYDAVTFHPSDTENPEARGLNQSPVPWTRKGPRDQVVSYLEGRVPFDVSFCSRIRSSECKESPTPEFYTALFSTWMGMNQVMMGWHEVMDNPDNPALNLAATSERWPLASPWQKLGKRGHWSGEGFTEKDFDFDGPLDPPPSGVVFRCMRYE